MVTEIHHMTKLRVVLHDVSHVRRSKRDDFIYSSVRGMWRLARSLRDEAMGLSFTLVVETWQMADAGQRRAAASIELSCATLRLACVPFFV